MSNDIDNFNNAIEDIVTKLKNIKYNSGDFTSIGAEIGYAIGKYTVMDDAENNAFDLDTFIDGIKYGVSIVDGTHDE